jgi:mycothiol synthase
VVDFSLVRPIAPGAWNAIEAVHAAAEQADGHPSLNEDTWRDLDDPQDDSAGVLAADDGEPVGYLHLAPRWSLGLVIRPERRGQHLERGLLDVGTDWIAEHGGGEAILWTLEPDDAVDADVTGAGFHHQRDLLQQRVPLPLATPAVWPDGITVRTFVPGDDDAAWLGVNNRAFHDHPEQGGWDDATLQGRMGEAWFDPEGFLLAFDADGLAGFCWTKVHAATDLEPEPLGEIYVIGVDPSRHSRGLGRALTVAGLESLAARGIRTGMLFVDGANAPAVGLYESLGFRTHRHDRAYACEVAPA